MGKQIRMKSTAEKIEVNDNGDYILLPLGDDKFVRSFYKMLDDVQKKIKTEPAPSLDGDSAPESIMQEMDRVIDVSDFLFERTEKLFGEGTCQKVFGECRPGLLMFWEFFNAILPFMEEYQKDCDSSLKKYSQNRTGSV